MTSTTGETSNRAQRKGIIYLTPLVRRMAEKQIVRVLEAVMHGSRTTDEISALTGLPFKHCSAYLSELSACGIIEHRKAPRLGKPRPGRRPWFVTLRKDLGS